jgi:hypothetical protein
MVRALDNFGLAFVLVVVFFVLAVLVDTTGASSSVLVSDVSRASRYAFILFNLSGPQVCFKNS